MDFHLFADLRGRGTDARVPRDLCSCSSSSSSFSRSASVPLRLQQAESSSGVSKCLRLGFTQCFFDECATNPLPQVGVIRFGILKAILGERSCHYRNGEGQPDPAHPIFEPAARSNAFWGKKRVRRATPSSLIRSADGENVTATILHCNNRLLHYGASNRIEGV